MSAHPSQAYVNGAGNWDNFRRYWSDKELDGQEILDIMSGYYRSQKCFDKTLERLQEKDDRMFTGVFLAGQEILVLIDWKVWNEKELLDYVQEYDILGRHRLREKVARFASKYYGKENVGDQVPLPERFSEYRNHLYTYSQGWNDAIKAMIRKFALQDNWEDIEMDLWFGTE